MDDQKNLILAIILSTIVMMGYWFFFGKPAAELAAEQARIEAEQAATAPVEQTVIELRPRDEVVGAGQRIKIETPSLTGSFLVEGSRFDDIALKNYKKTLEEDSGDVILLTPEGAEKAAYIFDNWVVEDGGTGTNTPWSVISGATLTPTSPIVLSHEGNGFSIERTVTVDDRYLITLTDRVTNTSAGELNLVRKGAARQHGLPDDLTNFFILQEGPISIVDGKLFDMKYSKLADKRLVQESGESGWAGLTDKYWLSAAIAPQDKAMTTTFRYRTVNDQEIYEAGYTLEPMTLTPGTTIESIGYVFAGAKNRSVLVSYENDLGISEMERAIDWGTLRLLTRPMSSVLSYLGRVIGNYGLAILVLTLIIKLLLFPLFNKQYASQAKMKKVQPKLKKLQKLYGDDRMKLQQEMMALYKKEGVNPAAGCLPIIPTIFVFFALYKTVFINVELRHAPFFGYIQDLSARDPLSVLNGFGILPWVGTPDNFLSMLAIGPLAILYGITMAAMQTLTPMPTSGPAEAAKMQATIFKWMPWIFMFILAPFAAGLLVYWVWNNILSFGQQYYITRKYKVETPIDTFFARLFGKDKKSES